MTLDVGLVAFLTVTEFSFFYHELANKFLPPRPQRQTLLQRHQRLFFFFGGGESLKELVLGGRAGMATLTDGELARLS